MFGSKALNSVNSSRWGSLRKAPKTDALWWGQGSSARYQPFLPSAENAVGT